MTALRDTVVFYTLKWRLKSSYCPLNSSKEPSSINELNMHTNVTMQGGGSRGKRAQCPKQLLLTVPNFT